MPDPRMPDSPTPDALTRDSPLPDVPLAEHRDALVATLLELDRHLGAAGWDQPTRLFGLVLTDQLAAAEPALAADLGLRTTADGAPPAALTAVEQEDFVDSGDLLADLAALEWPDTVFGCAVSTERSFLPAAYEDEIPDDPVAATQFLSGHPARQDLRVVVGADRLGHRHGVARLATQPDELLGGENLVPGLAAALARTLASEPGEPAGPDETLDQHGSGGNFVLDEANKEKTVE